MSILIISSRPAVAGAFACYLNTNHGPVHVSSPGMRFPHSVDTVVIDCVQLADAPTLVRRAAFATAMPPIVALVRRPSDYIAAKVRESGARAVLSEADGLAAWDDVLRRVRLAAFQTGPSFSDCPRFAGLLTQRQSQIYDRVIEGRTDEEIAAELGISVATAETHRRNLQIKLGCRGHWELLAHALRHGVIEPVDLPHASAFRQVTRQHRRAR